MILEIAGLVLLAGTLAYTAYAAHQAAKAASAARDAITNERAWIVATDAIWGAIDRAYDDSGKTYERGHWFAIRWTNSGSTPARDVQIVTAHQLVPMNKQDFVPFPPVDWSADKSGTGSIAGPSLRFGAPARYIIGDEYVRLFSGQFRLVIFSRVRYFDIYDNQTRRVSEAFQEFIVNGTRVENGVEVPNIQVRSVGRHTAT